MFLKMFPGASGVERLGPCCFYRDWEEKYCDNYTDCYDCIQEFWDSEYKGVKDE